MPQARSDLWDRRGLASLVLDAFPGVLNIELAPSSRARPPAARTEGSTAWRRTNHASASRGPRSRRRSCARSGQAGRPTSGQRAGPAVPPSGGRTVWAEAERAFWWSCLGERIDHGSKPPARSCLHRDMITLRNSPASGFATSGPACGWSRIPSSAESADATVVAVVDGGRVRLAPLDRASPDGDGWITNEAIPWAARPSVAALTTKRSLVAGLGTAGSARHPQVG